MKTVSSIGLAHEIQSAALKALKSQDKPTGDFGQHMTKALGQVAEAQNESARLAQAFETGDETDVAKVMLAREKSSLAFEATLQVRNKLLSAYKDIVSMPV